MAGVTDEGFEAETVDTLKTAIENELKNSFGDSFNVRPTSVAGIIIGVVAQKLGDLWDAAEAIYGSQYPATAFGQSLDQLSALTGVQRLAATHSEVTCDLEGTPGTLIPEASRIRNADTGTYWRSQEDVTIGAASAATAVFESEDYGEILGVADSLTVIDTVISGWDSVNNPLDADLGRELETDAELRLRRADLLTTQGAGTVDAIRADVLAVLGVQEAHVFENVTLVTDGDGLPGKAFEVVLRESGAVTADILQAIWDTKPAGISAHGTSVGYATDSEGNDQLVAYSNADEIEIYIAVTAVTGANSGPTATVVENIKSAIVEYGDAFLIGDDVIKQAVQAQPFDVAGITDVPTLKLDIYASPTATSNIVIGTRQVATFDTSRITVALQ